MIDEKKDVAERFNILLKILDLNARGLADLLGFDRPDKLYNIINEKNLPSFEILQAMSIKIDNFNIDWFINGRGEAFFNSKNAKENAKENAQNEGEIKKINSNLTNNTEFLNYLLKQSEGKDGQIKALTDLTKEQSNQINRLLDTVEDLTDKPNSNVAEQKQDAHKKAV